ncbi:MAG: hypothetical protein L3J97_05710 [Thermoplasmata archaeon]|nr:hypothetical protein [Thermoplasmata archaeon]
MLGQCAICEASVADNAENCGSCGFPMAMSDLAARLMVELPEPEAATGTRRPEPDGSATAPSRDRTSPATGRDPQVEVVNRIARDVSHAVSLLQDLGGDGGDISNELAQAAFTEAEGRVGEVLVLLRDAQGRVSIRLKEQFDARVKQLEERQAAMIVSGVSINLAVEVDRIRTDIRAGRREAALQRIDLADRTLSRMESDWRGLQGLLRQIETLREAARLLELDVAESDDSLREVRVILAQPALDIGGLDHAAEIAAEALMRLHDSIPLAVEESLDRLSGRVASWPPGFGGRRRAVELDREAHKLLKANRLAEATQRAVELRQMVTSTGVPPVPSAAEEPPPTISGRSTSETTFATAPRPADRIPPRRVERIDRPPPQPRPPLPNAPGASAPPRPAPPSTANQPAASATSPAAPGPPPPDPALAKPAPQAADTVRTLVGQARALAARIQQLPGDSALARAAAVEIRNATELLRERKMDEAERTLAELKERLDHSLMENGS